MGLDSVELVMEIENYFDISIPDAEAETLTTVGKMADCVASHRNISSVEAPLRDELFEKIKDHLFSKANITANIDIEDKILNYFSPHKETWAALETTLNIKIPYPEQVSVPGKKLSDKIRRLISWLPPYKPEEITFELFISAICAYNFRELFDPANIKNKYEIYIGVMGITVDKIGVDYYEVTPEKSFTSDLGVD
jgi:acyl carrier protein